MSSFVAQYERSVKDAQSVCRSLLSSSVATSLRSGSEVLSPLASPTPSSSCCWPSSSSHDSGGTPRASFPLRMSCRFCQPFDRPCTNAIATYLGQLRRHAVQPRLRPVRLDLGVRHEAQTAFASRRLGHEACCAERAAASAGVHRHHGRARTHLLGRWASLDQSRGVALRQRLLVVCAVATIPRECLCEARDRPRAWRSDAIEGVVGGAHEGPAIGAVIAESLARTDGSLLVRRCTTACARQRCAGRATATSEQRQRRCRRLRQVQAHPRNGVLGARRQQCRQAWPLAVATERAIVKLRTLQLLRKRRGVESTRHDAAGRVGILSSRYGHAGGRAIVHRGEGFGTSALLVESGTAIEASRGLAPRRRARRNRSGSGTGGECAGSEVVGEFCTVGHLRHPSLSRPFQASPSGRLGARSCADASTLRSAYKDVSVPSTLKS